MVVGMEKILYGVRASEATISHSIVANLVSHMPVMWDAIWDNRNLINVTDPQSPLVWALSKVLMHYPHICEIGRCLPPWRSSRVEHVAFVCWCHGPSDHDMMVRSVSLQLLVSIRRTEQAELFAFFKELTDEYGTEGYVRRLARDLKTPRLISESLLINFEFIGGSTDIDTLYAVSKGPETIARALIAALKRQWENGNPEFSWHICSICCMIMRWFTKGPVMKTLIADLGVISDKAYVVGTVLHLNTKGRATFRSRHSEYLDSSRRSRVDASCIAHADLTALTRIQVNKEYAPSLASAIAIRHPLASRASHHTMRRCRQVKRASLPTAK
ncbi:hypothetical protein OF83DRAFT_916541 [Amylostereum chailletii]|nr:hypothetical protein OF83DRAFT_916541 [Amylostereum chailletii]